MTITKPVFQHSLGIFIDREPEIGMLTDLLEGMSPNQRVLEITGISGQGKTELLIEACNIALSKNIITAYVDFGQGQFQTIDILAVLEVLAIQLFRRPGLINIYNKFNELLEIFFKEYSKFKNALLCDTSTADRSIVNNLEKQLIELFRSELSALLTYGKQKVLICLDSLEKAFSRIMIKDLEEQIFSHVINCNNFFLIVASRKYHDWESKDIRRESFQLPLTRFYKNYARGFLKELTEKIKLETTVTVENYLFEKMWELTLGHPYYGYIFINFVNEGATSPLTLEIIERQFPLSLEYLIENFINNQIFWNQEIRREYPSLGMILTCLSPLRRMEYGTFHFILSTFMSDEFQDKGPYYFQTLLGELLGKTHIFISKGLGWGYDMEELSRNILLTHLKVNNENLYIKIQKALAENYDLWTASSSGISQVKCIIEHIYHHLTLKKAEDIDLGSQKHLERYLKKYFTRDYLESDIAVIEQCNRLKDALANDDELKGMIDTEKLIKMIEFHLKECLLTTLKLK